MAGRGTDIKLGGNKDYTEDGSKNNLEEHKKNELKVKEAGGLCIIGTERHESRRIDNQLEVDQEGKEILVLQYFL